MTESTDQIDVSASILNSTKKKLGLDPEYDVFDLEVMTHINSVFSTLTQLGVGPAAGFQIEDDSAVWNTFLGADPMLNLVKTYVYLKVKLIFDPPQTGFVTDSYQKQIEQMEWRLNVAAEGAFG